MAAIPGCAQLFGIQETSGGDGGTADADPAGVSAKVQRISIGTTAARSAYDISHYPASFFVADNSPQGFKRVAATAAGDTWSAAIPDGNPPMEVTLGLDLPDVFRRLYALPQRNLQILYGIYEQPNAPAAPANGALQVTVTLPAASQATESYQLFSVGSWANHGFTPGVDFTVGAATIGPVDVPFNATLWGNISGRPFTKITSADELLALRYVGAQLTGAAEFAAFDQSDTTTAINATMTPVAAAALDVHLSPTDIDTRLTNPTPKCTALAMNWSVNAAPGWEIANGAGPQLEAGGVVLADSGAITVPFGNPFAAKGWKSVFTWATNKSRTYVIPGLGNLTGTFYTGLNQIAEVTPGLTLDTPAAVPIVISINTTPLATDGATVALDPTKSVTLSLLADRADPLFYQFNVYELRVNAAGTALEAHVAYVAVTATTSVAIPNDVFAVGKTYYVRGHTINGGYPAFAQGNLWNRSLPYSVGYLDAGVFTVTAQ